MVAQVSENVWMFERACWADEQALTTPTVPRMQFYAVEIARNRKGLNDWIYEKTQAEKTDAK